MQLLIIKFINKETCLYLIFGVITTLINITIYEFSRYANIDYKSATIIAWLVAVVFAFITNKLFVFKSKSFKLSILMKEFISFIVARLTSGLFDLLFMIVAVDYLFINDTISKLISNIFVVVINYLLSKMIVFKKVKKESVL